MQKYLPPLLLIQMVMGQTVTATVDVNQLSSNETFSFIVEAQDAKKIPQVDLTPLEKDFTIISGPAQQSSYQIINGKALSSKSLTWKLVPNRNGIISIPELSVVVDGKKLKTNSIRMNVKSAPEVTNNNELFLLAEIDKDEAYIGEQITVVYKLYTRVQMSRGNINYPKNVGFWSEKLSVPQPPRFNSTVINGVKYNVATLYKVALFPTKTGDLTLSPMTLQCKVQVQSKRTQRSFFDGPFRSFFAQTVEKVLKSEKHTIHVQPYPPGQSASFTGAVGEFELKTSVDTDYVRANEAVTYIIELQGTGNLNMFSLPPIDFPETVEVFPPSTSFDQEQMWDQFTGKMRWEYILIPRQAGQVFVPRVEFTYFNPPSKKFETISTQSIEINIAPAKEQFSGRSSGFTKEEIALLGKDIHYNVTTPPTWIQRGSETISIWVWTNYILSVGLFLAPVTFTRFRARRLANAGDRRARGALKQARNSIHYAQNDPSKLSAAIYIYLKDRWQLESEKMDPLNVEQKLQGTIPSELLAELIAVLQACDAARYAPGTAFEVDIKNRMETLLKKVDVIS